MAGFNLSIDFSTAVSARLVQGVGMPLFFVSLSYLTFSTLPNPQMNNASAIFNLLRNLGGSFGVAFVTTLLARRGQFHQARLSEGMHPLDPGFLYAMQKIKAGLAVKLGAMADHTQEAYAVIYGLLRKEASAMAFNDAFLIQAALFLGMVSLLFLVKKPPIGRKGRGGGGH